MQQLTLRLFFGVGGEGGDDSIYISGPKGTKPYKGLHKDNQYINIYIYVSWKTEFYDRASYNNCCIDIPPEAHG